MEVHRPSVVQHARKHELQTIASLLGSTARYDPGKSHFHRVDIGRKSWHHSRKSCPDASPLGGQHDKVQDIVIEIDTSRETLGEIEVMIKGIVTNFAEYCTFKIAVRFADV